MFQILIDKIYEQLHAKFYNYINAFNPKQLIICFTIILGIMILRGILKHKKFQIRDFIYYIFLSLWLTLVMEITLLGRMNNAINTYRTIFSYFIELVSGNYKIVYDMLFNSILFIPFGILVNMKFSVEKTIIISIIFSLSIEVSQFVTHRGLFEISDLIFNVVGGIVGAVLVELGRKIYNMWKAIKMQIRQS